MEEGQPSSQGQPFLPRSRVSVKFFVKIYFRLYERRAGPPWRDLAIDQRSRLGGLEIFHINALKRAGLPSPRRASKSKLRTHDKVCLGQHFFGSLFILQVLFVYVQDSWGNECSRPGQEGWLFPCKREVKSSPFTRASPVSSKYI